MTVADDGCVDLVSQRAAGRCRAIKYALKIEEGDKIFDRAGNIHPKYGLEYYKVKRWRMVPDTDFIRGEQTHGWIDLDGERYPTGTCQGRVLPRSFYVLTT